MVDQIFLLYDQATSVADEIKRISQEVESLLESDVNTEVNSLLSEWEGSAAESFMAEYNRLRARFSEFYTSISNISETIKEANAQINGTDVSLS